MSQKLLIPNLGTVLLVKKNWTFRVFFEQRNIGLWESILGYKGSYWSNVFYNNGGFKSEDFEGGAIPKEILYEKALSEKELESAYSSYKATRRKDEPYFLLTIPKNTQLKVERIYVRNGGEAFASVTFRVTKNCPDKKLASKRFWAKLSEANELVIDVVI